MIDAVYHTNFRLSEIMMIEIITEIDIKLTIIIIKVEVIFIRSSVI